jgi:asparagine synthase (glutamine-hydrolysing)
MRLLHVVQFVQRIAAGQISNKFSFMCGILGITGNAIGHYSRQTVEAMLHALSRRGPDDSGVVHFSKCLLGHTRLSIIDLTSGHQPMRDVEKEIVIVLNGEIYNYRELKKQLEKQGYRFRTTSDTEVVLKAYQAYGEACVSHLDGMFAFAIWDNEKESLFLARDRFGKKPLYFTYDRQGNLLFASEIGAIFASGGIQGEIDLGAVDNYLVLRYVLPGRTIYKNIFTLAPAECAVYRNGRLSRHTYWHLRHEPLKITYNEAKEEVRRLFTEAVRKRLVGDVEIGCFLSGGVDSTLVTAYAQEFTKRPLKTFALRYGDYINELPYAEEASRKIRTDHYTVQAGENHTESLEQSLAYFDEPHAESSDFPQSRLSKSAASKVKVALSGDGADEVFMGYPRYWNHSDSPHGARVPDLVGEFIQNISIFGLNDREKLWGPNKKYAERFFVQNLLQENIDPVIKINRFDITTHLEGQYITKIDRMSMMHSLEVRSPFLDYRLAEFAFGLPLEYKKDGINDGKRLLKDLLREIMPSEFVNRKKQGFVAPLKQWLRSEKMAELVYGAISEKAHIHEFLQKEEINRVVANFYINDDDRYHRKVWSLLCLELWFKAHHTYITY